MGEYYVKSKKHISLNGASPPLRAFRAFPGVVGIKESLTPIQKLFSRQEATSRRELGKMRRNELRARPSFNGSMDPGPIWERGEGAQDQHA